MLLEAAGADPWELVDVCSDENQLGDHDSVFTVGVAGSVFPTRFSRHQALVAVFDAVLAFCNFISLLRRWCQQA
jgi:hypothetical protein